MIGQGVLSFGWCHPPVTVIGPERAPRPRPLIVPTGNVTWNLIRLQKTQWRPLRSQQEQIVSLWAFTNYTHAQTEILYELTLPKKHSNALPELVSIAEETSDWLIDAYRISMYREWWPCERIRVPPLLQWVWDDRLLHKQLGGAHIYPPAVLSLTTGSQLSKAPTVSENSINRSHSSNTTQSSI